VKGKKKENEVAELSRGGKKNGQKLKLRVGQGGERRGGVTLSGERIIPRKKGRGELSLCRKGSK